MAREIQIVSITAGTPASPGKFVVATTSDNLSGDWTSIFKGKYYRDAIGTVQPFYSSPLAVPAGYQLIEATTFQVKNNPTYNGKYTVYTQLTVGDHQSSTFAAGQTTINVIEPVATAAVPAHMAGTGQIYNVTTYYLIVENEAAIVVPPGINLPGRPVELVGRNYSGWGEVLQQNLLRQTQNFSGSTSPASPYRGQLWYDTSASLLKIFDGSTWQIVNSSYLLTAGKYTHTQGAAATTWTITHNLGTTTGVVHPVGFVHSTIIVDTGGGIYKPILPQDVTYVSTNQLTVSFSTAYAGYALISI